MQTIRHQDTTALTAYLNRRTAKRLVCPIIDYVVPQKTILATLLHRYPYLYKSKNSASPWLEMTEKLQQRVHDRQEIQISQFMLEQMRRSQPSFVKVECKDHACLKTARVHNPTLLSYFGLRTALQRFTGKVWGHETHQDLAKRFLLQTQDNSFGKFKHNFYLYLTASIPLEYGTSKFNQQLQQRLIDLMPERNDDPIDRFLITALARKVFQFITVENAQEMQHHVLIDLVSNLGPLCVAELLLRILLLCPHSRVHLDKRMRLLFHHYANFEQTDVRWLIQLLEYCNLAYSTNFGTIVLPLLR